MKIVNDCVKEGTLLLEVNGQCISVSDAMIKYDNFMTYVIGLIRTIDTKYARCCEIANSKITKLEDRITAVETQLKKCCSRKPIIYVPPTGQTGGIKPIKSISVSVGGGSVLELPYDFRSMYLRKIQNKTTTINPIRNTKYYSDKEKEALVNNIQRVNPDYGKEFVISSSGKKYYIL